GENVTFQVSGGGSVASPVATNSAGLASTTWTLGTTEGTQTLTAISSGVSATTTAIATPLATPSGANTIGASSCSATPGGLPTCDLRMTLADAVNTMSLTFTVRVTPASGAPALASAPDYANRAAATNVLTYGSGNDARTVAYGGLDLSSTTRPLDTTLGTISIQ